MTGHISPYGCLCKASEWTLCRFATYLADSLRHSSIKVYPSALRSLHVDQGFPDPFENCLQLQRVVRRNQVFSGYPTFKATPTVSSNIPCVIYSALDLNSFDDVMFWAACILAHFGLLRSAKFTVPSLSAFNPSIHLSVSNVSVDVPLDPS